MNTRMLYIRYAICALVTAITAKNQGAGFAFIAFIIFNWLWNVAEEHLLGLQNRQKEAIWREKNK